MSEEITYDNCLMCIFSFNMDSELLNLISSIIKNCPEFDLMIIDDASSNPKTKEIIDEHASLFKYIQMQDPKVKLKSRGGLAENIKQAYDFAINEGYKYLFMVQDDMQFVRKLDSKILQEYSEIFTRAENIIQVDPRFLRRLGDIDIDEEMKAYSFPETDDRRSYADVGILHLDRLKNLNWTFENGERPNKVKAHGMGLRRIFPSTPIMMHVPYPKIYRKGKEMHPFPSPFVIRGKCYYEDLTEDQKREIDTRPLSNIPYARDYLKPKNLFLAGFHYYYWNENRVFS